MAKVAGAIKFNDITQAMLEDYEEQYFDELDVSSMRGAHRNATGNIKAAENAGWLANSVNGLKPQERIQLSSDIDSLYREFTVIDPSG